MFGDNPYESPREAHDLPLPSARPLVWSVCGVFGCAVLGGLLGAVVGSLLGVFWPGYYRSVISGGDSPEFDPVAVGLGLGLSQGTVAGGLAGLILAAMYYWYQLRILKHGKARLMRTQ